MQINLHGIKHGTVNPVINLLNHLISSWSNKYCFRVMYIDLQNAENIYRYIYLQNKCSLLHDHNPTIIPNNHNHELLDLNV